MKLRALLSFTLTYTSALLLFATTPHGASASGPVERMVQVIRHPKDPNVLVVRYAAASEGFLFSRDGGKSFKALCTGALDASVNRISVQTSLYVPPATMDADGKISVNAFDTLWTDDGTGCSWTKSVLDGKWITGLVYDAKSNALLSIANVSNNDFENLVARSELLRKAPDGSWEVVGFLKPPAERTRTYGADLLVASTAEGTRLYATIVSSSGPITAPQVMSFVASNDGGKTWTARVLPSAQQDISLLAVDPTDANRILATIRLGNGADPLLVSVDGGNSFTNYGKAEEVSGVTFTPDGRVFIGDAGDGAVANRPGGVFTAPRLGEPLTRVPNAEASTPDVDCIDYDASAQKLRVCRLHRFGELDWNTGAFHELVRFESVAGLLECPGRDMKSVCEPQLNEGAAWCCTGHYPFTGFCGDYDITRMNGRPVTCGLAGRAADVAAGRGPTLPQDDAAASPLLLSIEPQCGQ